MESLDDTIIGFENEEPTKKELPDKEFYQIKPDKSDVNAYDIFKLAQRVLLFATLVFILLALLRIFYNNSNEGNSPIKEVWDYSKVILNSIISLVLGLYFGASHKKTVKKF